MKRTRRLSRMLLGSWICLQCERIVGSPVFLEYSYRARRCVEWSVGENSWLSDQGSFEGGVNVLLVGMDFYVTHHFGWVSQIPHPLSSQFQNPLHSSCGRQGSSGVKGRNMVGFSFLGRRCHFICHATVILQKEARESCMR
jgi:hypothetical protein